MGESREAPSSCGLVASMCERLTRSHIYFLRGVIFTCKRLTEDPYLFEISVDPLNTEALAALPRTGLGSIRRGPDGLASRCACCAFSAACFPLGQGLTRAGGRCFIQQGPSIQLCCWWPDFYLRASEEMHGRLGTRDAVRVKSSTKKASHRSAHQCGTFVPAGPAGCCLGDGI